MNKPIVLAVTGATGGYAAALLMEKAKAPIWLVASRWGRHLLEEEAKGYERLKQKAQNVFENEDLSALISSGSVETRGMIILPCSANTMAQIAAGMGDSLVTRAAHCHLKERKPLILCVRETPWTGIDIRNAGIIDRAGGIIMPLSPPFYMFKQQNPESVTLASLLSAYVDRVLSLVGQPAEATWEKVK